jgi:hypothetical protein
MLSVQSDQVIASLTRTIRIRDRRSFTVVAKLHQIQGKDRPYFSVTGEVRNLRRKYANQVEEFGQCQDYVVEHFPFLAPVVALDRADDHGVPMYAIENGAYWLGIGDPRYLPENTPDFAAFAKLWRITDEEARAIYDFANIEPHPTDALRFLAMGMASRWQAEADNALRAIRFAS